ncbi:MAG: hypothetical protein Q4B28_08165, partial [bacterium]|nr:hypothetical protein [bacterium]
MELRTLNMQIEAQKQGAKAENTDVFDHEVLSQLDTLQKRVDALDHKNTQHFQSEVQKIEEQLDTIKKT